MVMRSVHVLEKDNGKHSPAAMDAKFFNSDQDEQTLNMVPRTDGAVSF